MRRREFLQLAAGTAALAGLPSGGAASAADTGRRPNILWISCEDMSPDLPCYGNGYSTAPNLERFAREGLRYTRAFTHAGVCAPSRSGIITGMYPTTIGTQQMRCKGVPPPEVKCFTEYMRAAGYYCTNRSKTDYQFDPPLTAWDECGDKAHWRNRADGQPFFAVFNFTVTHESQVRSNMDGVNAPLDTLRPEERHDPAKAELPPYYPDTPAVRKDWAQYHDCITLMDRQAGEILRQLEEDGLAEDTIVWFWGDHGRGLPRAKRWLYDSGVHVPLLMRVPERYRALVRPDAPEAAAPGTVNEELVAFVDFAPTVLSLAGVPVPGHLQGRAFLGERRGPAREYVFGARDRMDEAYDIIRSVRDTRFKYIRNYMAHAPYAQDNDYGNRMPTMQEWRRLNAEGKLEGPQRLFFRETKPVEELYDTVADPHEINDLAGDPQYRDVLVRMREVHRAWMKETGDIGLVPEPEFDEMKRPGGRWAKTATPRFAESAASGCPCVSIACDTPGASIAYAYGDGPWRLYKEPVEVDSPRSLHAKACRIGYLDSDEAVYSPGAEPAQPAEPEPPHWRARIDGTDLLERLRAIKAVDGTGAAAIPAYLDALRDPDGSVRYWAAVGLRVSCTTPEDRARAYEALSPMLQDPSPAVRIAAAEALCGWDADPDALPVLVQASRNDPLPVARLHAVAALNRLGDRARPALPALEAAMKDGYEYVTRVAKYALRRFGKEEAKAD